MNRLTAMVGGIILLACLSACLRPGASVDHQRVAESLRSSVLGTPGVTGGSIDLNPGDGLGGPFVVCNLTSTATTPEELATTLDRVLQAITSAIAGYSNGTVSCAVQGEGAAANLAALGLESPATFTELRRRYP